MDQSKKTMRHFYCRDVLWETFEQMANDFDCSIDYLVNEAMRYYARSKNYQSPPGPAMTGGQPAGNGANNQSGAVTYPPSSKPAPGSGVARGGVPTNSPPAVPNNMGAPAGAAAAFWGPPAFLADSVSMTRLSMLSIIGVASSTR